MTKIKKYRTNILFPRSSAIIGIGTIINIYGNYFHFNYSKSGEEADKKAIENDWGVIGNDIRKSIAKAKKELIASK